MAYHFDAMVRVDQRLLDIHGCKCQPQKNNAQFRPSAAGDVKTAKHRRDTNFAANSGGIGHHRPIHKTRLCHVHVWGLCCNDERCQFAHSLQELQEVPELIKQSICKAWALDAHSCKMTECQLVHHTRDAGDSAHSMRGLPELANILELYELPSGKFFFPVSNPKEKQGTPGMKNSPGVPASTTSTMYPESSAGDSDSSSKHRLGSNTPLAGPRRVHFSKSAQPLFCEVVVPEMFPQEWSLPNSRFWVRTVM